MSHSLGISTNFTTHQSKDTRPVSKSWAADRL